MKTLKSSLCLAVAALATGGVASAGSGEDTVIRATETFSMTVKNKGGEKLGAISDLMIDTESHEVAYTVLKAGGVLGVGGKLFAVPTDVYESASNSDGEKYLVVKAHPKKLESLKGIEGNSDYPAEARDDWHKKDVHVPTGDAESAMSAGLIKASTLIGATVVNEAGTEVGSIADLVYDYESDEMIYAAFSHGGVAGIGNTICAVPCDDVRLEFLADEVRVVINVREGELPKLKGFDQEGEWPNEADENWRENRKTADAT